MCTIVVFAFPPRPSRYAIRVIYDGCCREIYLKHRSLRQWIGKNEADAANQMLMIWDSQCAGVYITDKVFVAVWYCSWLSTSLIVFTGQTNLYLCPNPISFSNLFLIFYIFCSRLQSRLWCARCLRVGTLSLPCRLDGRTLRSVAMRRSLQWTRPMQKRHVCLFTGLERTPLHLT